MSTLALIVVMVLVIALLGYAVSYLMDDGMTPDEREEFHRGGGL